MPASQIEKQPWRDDHTIALVRAITHILLTHRSDIYARPGLEDVREHGSSRINAKIVQILKKLGEEVGNPGIVQEEQAAMAPDKKPKSPSASPKKRKIKSDPDK